MRNLTNKIAVITGAASGIGLAIAKACVAEGMQVAMVDVSRDRLEEGRSAITSGADKTSLHVADVADTDAMATLAKELRHAHGAIHLLCNNAGIAGIHRRAWNFNAAEWTRMIDVNLRGVINGVHAFLPAMVDQQEGHIVNTASLAGLFPTPMNAPYCAAKFGILGLSEALQVDLDSYGSKIGVSVLCPGIIKTDLAATRAALPETLDADERSYNLRSTEGLVNGMDPADLAPLVLQAVRDRRFYIYTHPGALERVRTRMNAMLEGGAPSFAL